MITLDGSTLEGGGQLVRVALSLSAIRRVPIRISRVRANRAPKYAKKGGSSSGGLKESHLAALTWLADVCGAKTQGDGVGSEEFVFRPTSRTGRLQGPQKSTIELKKPGSVWLVLQALLPFIVFSLDTPILELTIKGGTNVSKSMSGEYVQQVLLPTLRRLGVPQIEVDIIKRGWASSASEIGEVKVSVKASDTAPFTLPAFSLTSRGDLQRITVSVLAHHNTTRDIIIKELKSAIHKHIDPSIPIEVAVNDESGHDSRLYILAVAHTTNDYRLGRDTLYSRRVKNDKEARVLAAKAAEDVAKQLAEELKMGGCVDEFLQDQMVIWQALAEGPSFVDAGENGEGSLHTKTVRWVCEEMLGEEVVFDEDGWCRRRGGEIEDALDKDGVNELVKNLEEVDIRS
jgi:RNA 3'-terminal phosphate cyclase (ATP)